MTSPDQTPTPTPGSTLRRAYLTIERLERQLAEQRQARSEPVAIVGLGCRFPGGAIDGDTYWDLLRNGTDAVVEIPADRWDADAFYDERPQQPGKMTTRWGGFLDQVDGFDHDFFGISRREAISMDPQQRLTLEVAWEALENAGHAPAALAGSQTGVFMGVCSYDFAASNFQHPRDITAYVSTGTSHSVVTGRLSYLLDLRGPSVAVDTACSSSLVAVHQASQSLRAGECDLALAGGVNVVASPLPSIAFSQFPGMVSADGRCRTFDESADGYVRSEGCGIVVLKRLSDALRDRDRVLAVLRGGAVNQDGRSSGVTAPNGAAQRDVLRRALAASGVEPHLVSYIEAHGTGTRLGDPIEVEALAEVYGRADGTPVFLGSSKTNIGHAEGAAGIAGLIKTVLALSRDAIPPHVHFTRLNPHISFAGTTFAVPTQLTSWPTPEGRRIAGVSSFGFSGTNAHLVVEAPPEAAGSSQATGSAGPLPVRLLPVRPLSVLALSAKSPTALVALARRYVDRLGADASSPEVSPEASAVADVCFSANTGRSHLRHRLATVGSTTREIADHLADFVDGLPGDDPATGEAGNADVVFLFTGQGPQRVGMARDLYRTQPTFRATLERCDEILRPVLPTPLLSVLYPADPGSELVNETTYAQPALFAVEYAMTRLWQSWGVEPAAVLGHSLGEYVAACVAGVMTLEDGLLLAAERARLMHRLAETGAMATLFAAEEEVAEAVSGYPDQVSVAAVNGPANTTISGDRAVVAEICDRFTRRGVQAKLLRITTSSHSPLVEPILDPLRRAAERVRLRPPQIPLLSNLTGDLWPWDREPDADYWCRHARQPVRFAAGVATLREMGYHSFLEVGPAPTLLGLVSDIQPADRETLLLPSLRPKQDDWPVLLSAVAQLYVHGADIDWRGFDRDQARAKVALPTYPFERTRCWPQARALVPAVEDDGSGQPDGDAATDELDDGDLLYRLVWQPAPPTAPAPAGPGTADQTGETGETGETAATARTWLVLADQTGIGDALAALVAARGARCVRVVPGTQYRYDPAGTAAVRVDGPDDLRRLLTDADLAAGADLRVVHLWGLSAGEAEPDSVDALLRDQQDGCMSAVRVAQALATAATASATATTAATTAAAAMAAGPGSTRLWLVTRGAVRPDEADHAPLAVGQSTRWGLGRSLQQEHANLWGGLVDLDPRGDPRSLAAQLLAEIERGDREDQVALRGDRRFVARLVRSRLPDTPVARTGDFRTDASYLITGGLGGVGLAVARSLVRAGARRLVLIGRTPVPPRGDWADLPADHPAGGKLAAVRELEALGASVHLESFDIADADAAYAFLARFDREGWPSIRGVVHAAGVGEVAPLVDLQPADLDRHLRPKAAGAWVLHRLFADRPLDFFVLFSSTSSLLSSPFVASYAAANAYLDALALARRDAGKPGLSINWGIWADTGLATRGSAATPGLSRGMGTLAPSQALRVLHRLLSSGDAQASEAQASVAQVAVVPVDWAEWGRRYQEVTGSALLETLVGGSGGRVPGARPEAIPSVLSSREELLRLPAQERADVLTDQLLRGVAATLGAQSSTVRLDQPLLELGLDSLMAVELRNQVERRLRVWLPISVLLEGASVRNLADQVLQRLADRPDDQAPTAGAGLTIPRVQRFEDVATELLAELDTLSEDQARSVLGREGRQ